MDVCAKGNDTEDWFQRCVTLLVGEDVNSSPAYALADLDALLSCVFALGLYE